MVPREDVFILPLEGFLKAVFDFAYVPAVLLRYFLLFSAVSNCFIVLCFEFSILL